MNSVTWPIYLWVKTGRPLCWLLSFLKLTTEGKSGQCPWLDSQGSHVQNFLGTSGKSPTQATGMLEEFGVRVSPCQHDLS